MNKAERQRKIIQLIEQSNGRQMLGTHELATLFGVSEMTVRRDLQELTFDGLVQRQHGGAGPLRPKFDPQHKEIGILLESKKAKYSDPFFNAVLEGTDRRLQELGYRIAYINTGAQVITSDQARELMRSNAVSGMIVVGPPLGLESIEYFKANMNALVGTIEPLGDGHDAIIFDGYNGIQKMIAHLLKLGYRRLGFITGRYDEREHAYLDAVQANGLPSEAALCVTVPFGIDGWTPDLGHIGAQQLMELAEPPDAIVCASDRIAIGALQWLHQHNFRVPDDVAITGFDNIADSAFTAPSLTTVHVHKQLIGELAAERVVKRIENKDEIPLLIQTPTHLVIRQSCGSR